MYKKYWVLEDVDIDATTKKIINEYLMSLKSTQKRPLTIYNYKRILVKFFTEYPKPVLELDTEDILNWLVKHRATKKATSILSYISCLSNLFKFCVEQGYMERNLIKSRWRPKLPKPVPQYLDKTEQARVKLHADNLAVRDRAIVEFLLSSGCRRCELVALNVTDVDLANRTAWVTGKGQKRRQVHFSPQCALYLQKYLKTHPPHESALFLSRFGTRITGRSIFSITTKLGRRAALASNLGPHRLRHTFATNLLARGAELDFISDELGHSNLNTTRIYARLPAEQIVSLYRKLMG